MFECLLSNEYFLLVVNLAQLRIFHDIEYLIDDIFIKLKDPSFHSLIFTPWLEFYAGNVLIGGYLDLFMSDTTMQACHPVDVVRSLLIVPHEVIYNEEHRDYDDY